MPPSPQNTAAIADAEAITDPAADQCPTGTVRAPTAVYTPVSALPAAVKSERRRFEAERKSRQRRHRSAGRAYLSAHVRSETVDLLQGMSTKLGISVGEALDQLSAPVSDLPQEIELPFLVRMKLNQQDAEIAALKSRITKQDDANG